jgi:SAM-dependent methyltransferase
MKEFADTLGPGPFLIADIGSKEWSGGSYRKLFERPDWRYEGLDIDAGQNVDIVISGEEDWTNVPDGKYDIVISGKLLEHVRRPWRIMQEMARIVKPGGLVCAIAPYEWGYHPFPLDCWRIFPDGMKTIMQDAGLEVLEVSMKDSNTFGLGKKPIKKSS